MQKEERGGKKVVWYGKIGGGSGGDRGTGDDDIVLYISAASPSSIY